MLPILAAVGIKAGQAEPRTQRRRTAALASPGRASLAITLALLLPACNTMLAGQEAARDSTPAAGVTAGAQATFIRFDNGHIVESPYLAAYAASGGERWLGPAISRPFVDEDLGWMLQVFEYGVLAQDLAAGRVFLLPGNTLLGRQTAPVARSLDPGCTYVGQTGHDLCFEFRQFVEGSDGQGCGFPISDLKVDSSGILFQDFEFCRLQWLDGHIHRTPLGEEFFSARGYDPSLLEPASGPSSTPTAARRSLSPPRATQVAEPEATRHPIAFGNGLQVEEPFLSAYLAAGGVGWLGQPITRPLVDADLGWKIQVFEYGALAAEPSAAPIFLVQMNTLMGRQRPAVPASSDPACTYAKQTGHNLCYQFRTFVQEVGAARVGLPLSEMEADAGGILVQDFEYARLEWLNGQVHRSPLGRDFARVRNYAGAVQIAP